MNGPIVVTGASGFVGRNLVASLRQATRVVIPCAMRGNGLAAPDLQSSRPSHVFHLAAKTFVPDSWRDPLSFYEVNVMGTAQVLEFCRQSGASLTLLSSYVYGEPRSLPIPESHPVQATNPYAQSKILAEELASFYRTHHGVQVTIVRPFNLYGPGQSDQFLIPSLIRRAIGKESEVITIADERPKRDFLFVGDLVRLLVSQVDSHQHGGVFNAGSGVSHSVLEVAELTARLAGTSKRVVSEGLRRSGEILDTVADISQAREKFGWSPSVDLETGLRLTIESYGASA